MAGFPPLLTAVFALVVGGFMALDLLVLSRRPVVTLGQSLGWTAFWVSLAVAFGAGVWWYMGATPALTFAAAYLVEQSLSLDNLFVFLLVFQAFKVPVGLQRRVLSWGIIGALVLRGVCIAVGVAALRRFEWLTYAFGLILIVAGVKTALGGPGHDADPAAGLVVRTLRRVMRVSPDFDGERFFTGRGRERTATPLFLALVVVELSDIIFAVDSIPAVLAISTDTFIVYTSNVFALMGLRSIYFALAHFMGLFHFLKYALAAILILVGLKIGVQHYVVISTPLSLAVIALLLLAAVLASVFIKETRESVGGGL